MHTPRQFLGTAGGHGLSRVTVLRKNLSLCPYGSAQAGLVQPVTGKKEAEILHLQASRHFCAG